MHGTNCKSVYVHWDSYIDGVGRILLEQYDSSKANHLVALGDLSSLRPEIGEKHAFSKLDSIGNEVREYNEDWCTFYGRDRGEKGTEWQVAHTFAEFLEQAEACGAEYYYIMKDGVWYVGSMYGYEQHGLPKQGVTPLKEALGTVKDNA
jgi:hypothetical protein